MSENYRKYYNPIYKLWELQRKSKSLSGTDIWIPIFCRETEAEIDAELKRVQP